MKKKSSPFFLLRARMGKTFCVQTVGQFRTGNMTVSPIKLMELRAAQYADVVSLAQGIPSFDTPEVIKEAAVQAIFEGKAAKYSLTPGLPELREVVSEKLREEGMEYDYNSEIIVTCGSIEAITASLLAILKPGEEVIIPSPVYASYSEAVKLAHGVPVFVPLDEENGWGVSTEEFEKKITEKTRVIFYCNPSNPTGTIFTESDLMKLADIAARHDLFLLSDEVYKDFVYTDDEIFALAKLPELRDRVIRVFSFSKAYCMTGWRTGFVHSSAKNIAEILKTHDSMVTCAPVVSQYAAIAAFLEAEDEIVRFREAYIRRLQMTTDFLDSLPAVFEYVRPNASYFAFPKFAPHISNGDSVEFCYELLDKTGVALVPGVAFGPTGEQHVRISFGRSEEDLRTAYKRMYDFFG
jgi:aspartate/methionine/tyrosine aminotransferase